MDHLDRGDAHALHAGDPRSLDQQLAEIKPALRVPVVPYADARHHHLTLILCDAALDLVQYRRSRT